jgi:hypothetical protein
MRGLVLSAAESAARQSSNASQDGEMLMMTRTSGAWIRCRNPFAILAIVAAGMVFWHSAGDETHGQGKAKSKSKAVAPADTAPDLAADLDEAIRVVEAGEFQKFLERYAPVDILRRMRQQDVVEQAAAMLAQRPQGKAQILAVLQALKKQTPRYDKTRGLATIDFDPLASGVPEAAGELLLPATAEVNLVGLGDELPTVLAKAVKVLEAGDVTTFIEHLFPATELARLQARDQLQAVVQQFKDTPELATAMLADFKRMQAAKPELTEKGQVAVFRLAAGKGVPERTVKLQKGKGGWRLFDDAARVSVELARQARLKPQSGVMNVQLELIGGNWRFVELPMFGPSAN